jgi:hypothetical protein
MTIGFAVFSHPFSFNTEKVLAADVNTPIQYGAVYDTCIRFHEKEVLQACNYLCLYDKPCRDQCIKTSEEAVLNRECGKYGKDKRS